MLIACFVLSELHSYMFTFVCTVCANMALLPYHLQRKLGIEKAEQGKKSIGSSKHVKISLYSEMMSLQEPKHYPEVMGKVTQGP